ncbi:MAG TPA: class I SAM-dependent methyltransferase [Gaiellaceae bacterium]|nr:class I SAM-dependent methyltransferase [Gaiellaceae bacterium]
MNENHAVLCASEEWAEFLETEILTPLAAAVDLGGELLELGPGPGASTRWLRHRVEHLVALELDADAAALLAEEFEGTNVTVEAGDCTNVPFEDESFDSVASFTMLHHLPTQARQFAALSEAYRVLRPNGVLIGSDSIASQGLHEFHEGDVYNPIDPPRLLVFLQAAGFARVTLMVGLGLRFTAHKKQEEEAT